ncbi:substrate-binding domain-containing protein [Clostridium sp. SHJSY1]|uniref:substrate-binding domain-containing protein n=1 Tax=Clostridium sp. SHJSY1 TaxID=2942483 RepID=UPI002875AA2B|nr:substrate-binding domain-containing protein [Clostridium sp. SHJSY1]MDS0525118.1 substrate-binding domain-containing protein [Clostridium sp. SHJSY1]
MKILKRNLVFIIISVMVVSFSSKAINASLNISKREVAKIAVVCYDLKHPYVLLIKENLEKIQNNNPNKVAFTFFDSEKNSSTQLQNINTTIQNDFDSVILNVVEQSSSVIDDIVFKAKQRNIPLIFWASSVPNTDVLQKYSRAFSLNEDNDVISAMQGNFIVGMWNSNKEIIDKNGDDIFEYILLRGYPNNPLDMQREKSSIRTIHDGIGKTQELETVFAYWDENLAEESISSLFLKYGNKIDAIITTGDALAIGAVKALQKYDYNKGDKSKSILVVGIDCLPEAKNLVEKGFMAGTFYFSFYLKSQAMYDVSMNLISYKNPIDGTNLKRCDKKITITGIPEQYIMNFNS